MKNNHNFYDNLSKIAKGAISGEDIKRAQSGDMSGLIENLPEKDAKKVREILSSKEKRKEFLSSDAAQEILKLLGGKNNG